MNLFRKSFKKLVIPTVAILLVALPSMASAASVFTGGGTNSFATSPIQVVQGARVTITSPSSWPTVLSGQVTSAWAAVGNPSLGTIAQVGYAIEPFVSSTSPHYFYGEISAGGSYYEYDVAYGPATSSVHTFEIAKLSGYWSGTIDGGAFIADSPSVTPTQVQFMNETDTSGAIYLGTTTSKLKMANAQYWNGSASSSNTALWVWTTPTMNFTAGTGSQLDNTQWAANKYWTSSKL